MPAKVYMLDYAGIYPWRPSEIQSELIKKQSEEGLDDLRKQIESCKTEKPYLPNDEKPSKVNYVSGTCKVRIISDKVIDRKRVVSFDVKGSDSMRGNYSFKSVTYKSLDQKDDPLEWIQHALTSDLCRSKKTLEEQLSIDCSILAQQVSSPSAAGHSEALCLFNQLPGYRWFGFSPKK